MKEIVVNLIFAALLLIVVGTVNGYMNRSNEGKCKNSGGEYYRSLDAGKSLCKLSNGE